MRGAGGGHGFAFGANVHSAGVNSGAHDAGGVALDRQQCGLLLSASMVLVSIYSTFFQGRLANRLGDDDFNYREFIDLGTLAWCALAIGTAQAVLDYVVPYCNERKAFGEPISHRQAVAFMVADIAIELDAMRMLTYRAVCRAEQGKPFQRETHLARTLVKDKAMQIGTDGVQLLGGHGFTHEYPVERWYRDLRAIGVVFGGLHL